MDNFSSLMLYLITFGISIMTCKKYQSLYKENKSEELPALQKAMWLIFIIIPPVLISTLRFNVGTDYPKYVEIYNSIINKSLSITEAWAIYEIEPLYYLLNRLSYIIFGKSWGVFFVSSLIIHVFLILGIDYYKKEISMPMSLFIYYMLLFSYGLNVIRQTIAMSICFFALRYIFQKKIFKYLFWVLLATAFHKTAIICLVFYLLTDIDNLALSKLRDKVYYISIIVTPVFLVIMINLFINLNYFSSYSNYNSNLNLHIGFGFLLDILPILLPILIFNKQLSVSPAYYRTLVNLSLLNIPFQYIGYYIEFGSRLTIYSNCFYFILVPLFISIDKTLVRSSLTSNILNRFNKNSILLNKLINKFNINKVVRLYYIVYFLMLYLGRFYISGSSNVIPYDSFLW